MPQSVAIDFERVDGTAMFDTLERVRALEAPEVSEAILHRSIAEQQGYAAADLFAVAEIGRGYLESGGYRLAELIFEGLFALDPNQHYFVMALGLAKDRLGDKAAALACYRRARKLDPKDARAELNIAELLVERGNKPKAVQWVRSAQKKACAAGDDVLVDKATALLSLIGGGK